MSGDMLDGKVGRIYMPKQDLEGLALRKMKVRSATIHVPCARRCLACASTQVRMAANLMGKSRRCVLTPICGCATQGLKREKKETSTAKAAAKAAKRDALPEEVDMTDI